MTTYHIPASTYLVIDGSYYLFSIFFISKNDYIKRYPEWEQPDLYDWSTNPEFWEIYQQRFQTQLTKMLKRLHIPKSNVFFVREGKKSMIWRHAIYPTYKATRSQVIHHRGKDNLLGDLFPRVYHELLPNYHFKVLRVLTAEADDIIFLLTRYLEMTRRGRIFIISKDRDFIQLVSPAVSIHTIYLDNIMDSMSLTPSQFLQTKLLMGDSSDNIPPCINPSDYNLDQLLQNQLFEQLFQQHRINLEQLQLNRQLILYTHIPFRIKMQIHQHILGNVVSG